MQESTTEKDNGSERWEMSSVQNLIAYLLLLIMHNNFVYITNVNRKQKRKQI